MKKVLDFAFAIIGSLTLIIGLFVIIGAIVKNNDESIEAFFYGVLCVVFSFFIWGFAYIVEAACKYIERCEADKNRN